MIRNDIAAIQRIVGVTQDGFYGQITEAAVRVYLKNLMPTGRFPSVAGVEKFYGKPGQESRLVPIRPAYKLSYDGAPLSSVCCHELCAESLGRVFQAILGLYPDPAERHGLGLDEFGGIYNYRRKRGGKSLSMHAWGIAIDLSQTQNRFKAQWPMEATMPFNVIEAFAKEGWTSGGAFWGYDAMHFQATS